jgi:hypothetical protein
MPLCPVGSLPGKLKLLSLICRCSCSITRCKRGTLPGLRGWWLRISPGPPRRSPDCLLASLALTGRNIGCLVSSPALLGRPLVWRPSGLPPPLAGLRKLSLLLCKTVLSLCKSSGSLPMLCLCMLPWWVVGDISAALAAAACAAVLLLAVNVWLLPRVEPASQVSRKSVRVARASRPWCRAAAATAGQQQCVERHVGVHNACSQQNPCSNMTEECSLRQQSWQIVGD